MEMIVSHFLVCCDSEWGTAKPLMAFFFFFFAYYLVICLVRADYTTVSKI